MKTTRDDIRNIAIIAHVDQPVDSVTGFYRFFSEFRTICRGVFFFKQKTAYEMRISDWSSDVCSSDLIWRL